MLFNRTGSRVMCSGLTTVIACIYIKVLPLSLPMGIPRLWSEATFLLSLPTVCLFSMHLALVGLWACSRLFSNRVGVFARRLLNAFSAVGDTCKNFCCRLIYLILNIYWTYLMATGSGLQKAMRQVFCSLLKHDICFASPYLKPEVISESCQPGWIATPTFPFSVSSSDQGLKDVFVSYHALAQHDKCHLTPQASLPF